MKLIWNTSLMARAWFNYFGPGMKQYALTFEALETLASSPLNTAAQTAASRPLFGHRLAACR